jgi:hypothetical protein
LHGVMQNKKKVLRTFDIRFRMDHAIIFKGTRSSSSAIMTSCHRLARAHREHTAASHPVRHDGANPTRAGCRYALDSEIPLLAFVSRIPRTGFAGCYGRSSGISLRLIV